MITVQLPRSTVPEQERLQHSQDELFRAKQELQWEQLQVQQQHEKLARERCISAILAAHQKSRIPLDDLYPRPADFETDAAPVRELIRLLSETCRRNRVVSSATLLVAYVRHALECAKGMPAQSNHLVSTIALACGLREHQKRSSTKGAKRSSAKGGRRSAAKGAKRSSGPSSWMERARVSSWMERARAAHWMERAKVSHWASWRCFSQT
jgi:hypothetical protein